MSHEEDSDDKSKKKEKVLHTRVSEDLDEELKSRASQLGVTVSNLVRNVLLNAFELVEDVVADTSNIAGAAAGKRAKKEAEAEPLGWQELVLARNAVCDRCNQILPAGSRAGLATYEPGASGPKLIVCPDCMKGGAS
jgi:hypothetical protein